MGCVEASNGCGGLQVEVKKQKDQKREDARVEVRFLGPMDMDRGDTSGFSGSVAGATLPTLV